MFKVTDKTGPLWFKVTDKAGNTYQENEDETVTITDVDGNELHVHALDAFQIWSDNNEK
jgi:hypothetical protein